MEGRRREAGKLKGLLVLFLVCLLLLAFQVGDTLVEGGQQVSKEL